MGISRLARKMMAVAGAASLVFIAAGAVIYRSAEVLPFAYGVLLGTALNIGKIVLLEYSVNKTLGMEKSSAKNLLRVFYFLRFLLTGVLFYFAATAPFLNIWGALAGILTLQIAAFAMKFFHRDDEPAANNGESSPT